MEVRVENESVWLNLNQVATLFDRDKSVISRHISNIFKEKELDKNSTVAKNATVQIENGRSIVRQMDYYNLDVIISVGYRVKSQNGIIFRKWASSVLKDYLLKGVAINNKRLEFLEKSVKLIEIANRVKDRISDSEAKRSLPHNRKEVFFDLLRHRKMALFTLSCFTFIKTFFLRAVLDSWQN